MKMRNDMVSAAQWSVDIGRRIDGLFRDVRAILNGGLRLADQGQMRTFRWNSTHQPFRVEVAGHAPPLGLVLVRAVQVTAAGSVVSGAPITWRWDGTACAVTAIGTLTAAADWDVLVFVVEG